jgi:hypothetical protein
MNSKSAYYNNAESKNYSSNRTKLRGRNWENGKQCSSPYTRETLSSRVSCCGSHTVLYQKCQISFSEIHSLLIFSCKGQPNIDHEFVFPKCIEKILKLKFKNKDVKKILNKN